MPYNASSARSKKGTWTNMIAFIPEADNPSTTINYIDDRKLMELAQEHSEEKITRIIVYKVPLSIWQPTLFVVYHLFIVFQTEKSWWSIEKNSEGITIQTSGYHSGVKCTNRKKFRGLSISMVKEDTGSKSVKDFLFWLYNEEELKKRYHYLYSNCKTFAKRVFDHVAENSKLYWFDGAFTEV